MTIKVEENFSGYPDGKARRDFVKDEVVSGLPRDFEKLVVGKAHAVEVRDTKKADEPAKETAK